MSKKLKVGVIGVGGIVRAHMPGWAASEHAEVVAGCDLSEEALKTWGQTHNVSRLFTKPADLFADKDIDIIDICTPSNYHAPLTIAALEAGKHVICEKPLAPTPDEVRRMIAARDKSGKMLMTAQHMRFHGSSLALKAELDTGVLGKIYHARCWNLRRAAAPTRLSFLLKQHSGGGACIDIGVHILDLTLWMMGNPKPVSVTGVAGTHLAKLDGAFSVWGGAIPKEVDVEDFTAAFVRFDTGATLVLEISWILHHPVATDRIDETGMWIYGTDAGCQWPNCTITSSNLKTKQFHDLKLGRTYDTTPPHALECIEFARAIADGAPSPVPAEQSLDVMKILDGVYRSQAQAGEVRLD